MRDPDIEAEITLFAAEDGGRKTEVRSGYRPTHDFGVTGMTNDAQHDYADGFLAPGSTGRALLTLGVPDFQRRRLFEGMEFTVQEGGRVVGSGRIVRVLNEDLKRAV